MLNTTVFAWIAGINAALAVAFAFWVHGDARHNRRPAHKWFLGALVIGTIFGAPNGLFCYLSRYQATEKRHDPILWPVFCALFSIPGYIAFCTFDDCKSRQMNTLVWPGLAFLLALPALAPWLVLLILYMLFRRPVETPTITVQSIRERYAERRLLEPEEDVLLRIENVKKFFPVRKGLFSRINGYVKAVDDVSLFIKQGETLGLVGESGCGKTTLGRTILRLIPATDGRVVFDGLPLEMLSESELRVMRKELQIIFQDPFGSLNPRMNIENIVGEPMTIHKLTVGRPRRNLVAQLLERVGLSEDYLDRYPHEFSGGQRQRIGIARALGSKPRLIVCDEPVSALDVSIQAQIINLLKDLQGEFGLSYLFIAHDLRVVENISDRVAVMYLGKIVELATSDELYRSPRHPYTVALMSAIPVPDPGRRRKRILLPGDVPSPINPPPGCSFHPRCFNALPMCSDATPGLTEQEAGHYFACHNPVAPK